MYASNNKCYWRVFDHERNDMKPVRVYYIIFAVSRITKVHSYFRGLVTEAGGKTNVTNDWMTDKDFSTQFNDEALANRVAATFKNMNELMDFLVLEMRG